MTIEELKNDCNFRPYNIPGPVQEYAEKVGGFLNYVGWLTAIGDDIVLRIYAFRRLKNKPLDLREVIRCTPSVEGMVQRDMYLTAMAGWRVCFKPSRRTSYSWEGYNYYSVDPEDFGHWYWQDKCGIMYTILNYDEVEKTKYKYAGYRDELHINPISYWRAWMEDPAIEFFGKFGITPYQSLVNKAKKDRNFIAWMRRMDHIDEFGPQAIIYAYNHKMGLNEANNELYERNQALSWAKGYIRGSDYGFTSKDMRKIYEYATKGKKWISAADYRDYLEALRGLEMDLTDTKNIYPKDFRRMHNLRTNQWGAKKEKIKIAPFKKAVKGYKKFEADGRFYVIVIPNVPGDLRKEGEALDHCVGRMGYDRKMINGESFIAFLRRKKEPDKPYVTIEYGLKNNKVLQCYGIHDSKPNKSVMNFVHSWEEECRKKVKNG